MSQGLWSQISSLSTIGVFICRDLTANQECVTQRFGFASVKVIAAGLNTLQRINVITHAHTQTHTHTNTHTQTHANKNTHIQAYTHTHTQTQTNKQTYSYTNTMHHLYMLMLVAAIYTEQHVLYL